MTKTKRDPMSQARKRVVLNHAWWGALSLRLTIVPDESIPTAATDGRELHYNPTWFESLTKYEQDAVVAHETEHCALGHPWRLGSRDQQLANAAMDHVINLDLKAAGFRLPEPHLADPRFAGMAYEKVYAIMEQERRANEQKQGKDKPSGSGQGEASSSGSDAPSDPNTPEKQDSKGNSNKDKGLPQSTPKQPETEVGQSPKDGAGDMATANVAGNSGVTGQPDATDWGHVSPAPTPKPNQDGEENDLQREWEKAVETTNLVATKAGEMPASLKRTVSESKRQTEDLIGVLQEFISVKGGYSFASPNRRMLHRGIYLPGRKKSHIESIVFAVDTSGSIGGPLLNMFRDKCNEVLSMDVPPETITILYCDAKVQRADEFTDGQIEFHPVGGGGTAFKPVFDYVEAHDIAPHCLVFLTDLCGSDNHLLVEPDYPVLWVTPIEYEQMVEPFGRRVSIDSHAA